MKVKALFVVLVGATLASGLAVAQHAATTPTAEAEPPRSMEELGWNRLPANDSVLAGGNGWGVGSPPQSSVSLPTLCELDPGHASCSTDDGGGGGVSPEPSDPPPFDTGIPHCESPRPGDDSCIWTSHGWNCGGQAIKCR